MARSCDSRCYNSRSSAARCRCVCGGTNHGSGAPMSLNVSASAEGENREVKSRVTASLGGTSYNAEPAYTVAQFNTAYFQSGEYQGFERDIAAGCEARGVQVEQMARVMGIWEGQLEPAIAATLHGVEKDILDVARQLGARYKQYGMLIVVPDPTARQYSYTIKDIAPAEVTDCIAAMKAFGVDGGRYVNGRIEVADKDNIWRVGVEAVAQELGKPLERIRARITLLEGDEPGKAEGKDYKWVGPRRRREGASDEAG